MQWLLENVDFTGNTSFKKLTLVHLVHDGILICLSTRVGPQDQFWQSYEENQVQKILQAIYNTILKTAKSRIVPEIYIFRILHSERGRSRGILGAGTVLWNLSTRVCETTSVLGVSSSRS